jgi:hypothetical protein
MVDTITIYFGLAISGFFTGIGVVSANYVYDRWIRKHLDKIEIKKKKPVKDLISTQ